MTGIIRGGRKSTFLFVSMIKESYRPAWADLPGAVAALAGQVLAVGQQAGGPRTLERQPGVYEGGGSAVVIHEERLLRFRKHCEHGGTAEHPELF